VLNYSVDPPDTAASECAAGCPAVETGDWRGNNHSPKPCLHITESKVNTIIFLSNHENREYSDVGVPKVFFLKVLFYKILANAEN
jgi:hypothetical protein